MTDAEYVDLVERLDKEVAAVDGRGFEITPFARNVRLSDRLGFSAGGGVWVKDETGNVSGSHKARHLFGLLLHLSVIDETGAGGNRTNPPELAVASCGNAALAAALVAKAAGRTSRVFVPAWADPVIVDRLASLDALVDVCQREPGVSGDPTLRALRMAVANGAAYPFTCQGTENGLAIEGGQTLAYEMADGMREAGTPLDRVLIQVGGGALASAAIAGFGEARALGAVDRMPAFFAVQSRGGYPLKRAHDAVVARIVARIESETGAVPPPPGDEPGRARFIREWHSSPAIREELAHAAHHRSEFMWPWEVEPASVATGILDDETYDWLAVVRGMIDTAGHPVVVEEETLLRANELAVTATGIEVDHTGSSGLAGLMELLDRGEVDRDERIAVLFTGARRPVR
jgi:threonine dehydratase